MGGYDFSLVSFDETLMEAMNGGLKELGRQREASSRREGREFY